MDNTELDVNKDDEGVLKELLYDIKKSIDQSIKNLHTFVSNFCSHSSLFLRVPWLEKYR